MKPFYRILTYLVLVVQSFVILFLLAEQQQEEEGGRTVVCATKYIPPKLSVRKVMYRWELPALPAQLLFFKFHYCNR